jgi:hypothetical protein
MSERETAKTEKKCPMSTSEKKVRKHSDVAIGKIMNIHIFRREHHKFNPTVASENVKIRRHNHKYINSQIPTAKSGKAQNANGGWRKKRKEIKRRRWRKM